MYPFFCKPQRLQYPNRGCGYDFKSRGAAGNPGLKRFLESTGLDFRAHDTFTKADIEERTALYQKLAEMIWSPTLLMKDAQSLPERT